MTQISGLASFLQDTFTHWRSLPIDCWIRRAIEHNQPDFSDVLDAVTRGGQRAAFSRRLLTEHTSRREHSSLHDDRVLDAFTEAEAFAWATDVGGFASVEFITDEGCPDLRADDTWIEAKTVNASADDEWNRQSRLREIAPGISYTGLFNVEDPSSGLEGKFESHVQNALKKAARVRAERPIVFYCFARHDLQVDPEGARQLARDWAARAEAASAARIVICHNHRWATPIYP